MMSHLETRHEKKNKKQKKKNFFLSLSRMDHSCEPMSDLELDRMRRRVEQEELTFRVQRERDDAHRVVEQHGVDAQLAVPGC